MNSCHHADDVTRHGRPDDATIPILLAQRPGAPAPLLSGGSGGGGGGGGGGVGARQCALGYGAGWDLIIPSGWGMAFWLPLVLSGCRAVGLEEHHNRLTEMARLCVSAMQPSRLKWTFLTVSASLGCFVSMHVLTFCFQREGGVWAACVCVCVIVYNLSPLSLSLPLPLSLSLSL
jgi:hypothetical protein